MGREREKRKSETKRERERPEERERQKKKLRQGGKRRESEGKLNKENEKDGDKERVMEREGQKYRIRDSESEADRDRLPKKKIGSFVHILKTITQKVLITFTDCVHLDLLKCMYKSLRGLTVTPKCITILAVKIRLPSCSKYFVI